MHNYFPKERGICVAEINKRVQKYYNRNGDTIPGTDLRVGDKVMQNVNNKEKNVFNGSVMIINKFFEDNDSKKFIICGYYNDDNKLHESPNDQITYESKEFSELNLAYSFTVHKSQGKGYDAVVLLIHSSMGRMLNKKLLYTGITRAKKNVSSSVIKKP